MLSDLAARAEAFLFSEGGSLTMRRLADLLHAKNDALDSALSELTAHLAGSGLSLVRSETEVALATSPETVGAVKAAYQEELARDIGDAGLEVLAVVLYRGASTRAQIDYIRGVNTSSTMRNLLARGLLERSPNPEDAREYLYRPTVELLAHLGARDARELPDHATITAELAAFEATKQREQNEHAE